MSMKWNAENIKLFLSYYKQYPSLYNITDIAYRNRQIKNEHLNELLKKLNKIGMKIDVANLKKKIKSIKDTYRTELTKVRDIKNSDNESDHVYEPKLAWFESARFLEPYTITRNSSNLDINVKTDFSDCEENNSNMDSIDSNVSPVGEVLQTTTIPFGVKKKRKMMNNCDSSIINNLETTLNSFKQMKNYDLDPCDAFGQYVASQLKELPKHKQLLLQKELQNVIIECMIEHLNDPSEYLILSK